MATPAVKLELKRRKSNDEIYFGREALQQIVDHPQNTPERVVKLLRGVLVSRGEIHDKRWLEMICSYPLTEGESNSNWAPWMRLSVRVDALDPEKVGTFQLSAGQVKLIQDRIKSKAFKPDGRLAPQYSAFVIDFARATNWHLDDHEDDDWFDSEFETASETHSTDSPLVASAELPALVEVAGNGHGQPAPEG